MSPEKLRLLKVDNWGSFILQRLQLMFAKGDFCDLTLKFQDQQELKVHKLVLTTCTKYFEEISETDNMINMPSTLSYNTMLPIVNFMYCGRLEFKPELHESLLTTAKTLNMAILVQLLMAQKQSNDKSLKKDEQRKTIKVFSPPQTTVKAAGISMMAEKKLPFWKKRAFPFQRLTPKQEMSPEEDPLPTRFEWPSEDTSSLIINSPSFSSISYESEPVMTSPANTLYRDSNEPMSGAIKKRVMPPLSGTGQKMPKLAESQIIMGTLSDDDDDSHFETLHSYEDSDDEQAPTEVAPVQPVPKPILKPSSESNSPGPSKKVRFSLLNEDKENSEISKPDEQMLNNTQTPSAPEISRNQEIFPNHAKIIAEVFKKFPDLVKSNKNIKLKITSPGSSTCKTVTIDSNLAQPPKSSYIVKPSLNFKSNDKITNQDDNSNNCSEAENVNGPWICKKCSVNHVPLNFESYYLFRKHLQNVHNEKIDSKICEYCGYKASKRNLHLFHLYTKHNVAPPKNVKFPKCNLCKYVALNENLLSKHVSTHQVNKELICNICKLSFKSSSSFQAHCVTCKPTNEIRNYICKNCNKHFRTNVSLKAHYKDCKPPDSESNTLNINTGMEPVEMIEVPIMEAVANEKGEHSLMQLPPGIIVTESSNVALLQQEATGLNSVTPNIPTSIGFTVLPEDHQTVILLDENSEFFLQGNNSVVVTSENDSQEYIVPEILPDNVTRLYTSGNISYAMNATSVITYPVVHVPAATIQNHTEETLTSIPVSESGDLYVSDKEITISADLVDHTSHSVDNVDMTQNLGKDITISESQNVQFVKAEESTDGCIVALNSDDNGIQNTTICLEDDKTLSLNHSIPENMMPNDGQTIDVKAKDLSTDWDFENDEDDNGETEIVDDPNSRPSRPSIELQEIG